MKLLIPLMALLTAGASAYLTLPQRLDTLAAARAEGERAEREVASAEARIAELPALRLELDSAQRRYSEYTAAYPPEENLSALTALVLGGARDNRLTLGSMSRARSASGLPGIEQVEFTLALRGPFENFYELLHWVPEQNRRLSVPAFNSSVGETGEHQVTVLGYIVSETPPPPDEDEESGSRPRPPGAPPRGEE